MSPPRDFAASLAVGGHSASEIFTEVQRSFPENFLSMSQVYRIRAEVMKGSDMSDKRGKGSTKTARTPQNIASVEDIILRDRRVTMSEIEEETQIPHSTVHRIVTEDLGLSKKSARWVPRLLTEDMKKKRIEASEVFVKRAGGSPEVFLLKIITMDETMVSFYTPESKEAAKQWLPKGSPAPTKAKVQASRKKQMVFSFFDDSGSVYQHYAAIGATINGEYILGVLTNFLHVLKRKRPDMCRENGFIFHWDNAPVHTATSVRDFLRQRRIECLIHPPYSPDLTPADFFLFPLLKKTARRSQNRWRKRPEALGTPRRSHPSGRLQGGLSEVVRAPFKMYSCQRRLC